MFPPRTARTRRQYGSTRSFHDTTLHALRIAPYPQSIPQFCTILNTSRSSFPLSSIFFPTSLLFFHLTQKWQLADVDFCTKPIAREVAWQQWKFARHRKLPAMSSEFQTISYPEV
jgi:hypothetical protein